MNISESMKFVLKNKGQLIFSSILKEDLKNILKDTHGSIVAFGRAGKKTLVNFSVKNSFEEIKDSIQGTSLLIKVLPQRVNEGFKNFSNNMIIELDKKNDSKEKTVFCMKVIAGLCRFALSSAYDVGVGEMRLLGFGTKKIYSRVILSKLLFKLIQSSIIRLIDEMEKEVTDIEERAQLESYKKIILNDEANAIDKIFEGISDPTDPAFVLVENFKQYVLTGQKA
jgi:hypothetical protein